MQTRRYLSPVPLRVMAFVMLLSLPVVAVFLLASCGDDEPTTPARPTTVTEIDGYVYQTVTIGSQVWMKENLKVTHYRNGDPIPNVTESGAWAALSTGAYCNYDNDSTVVPEYGRLYNWYAINDSRNIAPEGWHVATDEEWQQLEVSIGISPATIGCMS